jgi:BASS family bile acid:Na+ symporter
MKPTENRTAIILRFIHRHFIWMIISSYIVAAIMPGFGLWIRNVSFGGAGILQNNLVLSLPLLMLAALLFNAGLGVKTDDSSAPKTIPIAWRRVRQFNDTGGLHRCGQLLDAYLA